MSGFTFRKKGTVNELAAPGAGNAIIPAVTLKGGGILHISIAVDTSTVVALKVDDGTTAHELDLNGGGALAASALHVWPVPVLGGYTYSLVIKTGEADSAIQHANFILESPIG